MGKYVLDQADLWIGDGTSFSGHLVVAGQAIESVSPGRYRGPLPVIDLQGMALSPGLIDIMLCGGFGHSLTHGDTLEIARRYLQLGVTTCQYCVGTLPPADFARLAASVRPAIAHRQPDAAGVHGVYFEGPFYHRGAVGANNADLVWPATLQNVSRLLEQCGDFMTMISVSPGIDGDAAAVSALREAGRTVTMSHSAAPADRVSACVDAGVSQLGHAWNNNSSPVAEPGVQQPTLEHVALTDDRVRFLHLICDGTHVHPVVIRLTLRCRGLASICLVSDAIMRAGTPDGPFTFDSGLAATKSGGVSRLTNGQLAGSVMLLPDQFRNFVRFTGIPPREAIRTVTLNPAAAIGIAGTAGMLAPGHAADLVAWDAELRVRRVWRLGTERPDVL